MVSGEKRRGSLPKRWAIAAGGCVGLLIAGSVYAGMFGKLSTGHQDRNESMFACMEREWVLKPDERAATCLCFVEKTHSVLWKMEQLVESATTSETSRRAARNDCLAADFRFKEKRYEPPR